MRDYTGLDFATLPTDASCSSRSVAAAPVASLHARLLQVLVAGRLQVHPLGSGEDGSCATRSRTFERIDAALLALSHSRGMASITTAGRRLLLLDVEDEGDGEVDDVVGEEVGEGWVGGLGLNGSERANATVEHTMHEVNDTEMDTDFRAGGFGNA